MRLFLQHSEEDCGAASLATVAKHYGRTKKCQLSAKIDFPILESQFPNLTMCV
ncbi:hypothetical protein IQ277_09780 [Nostocales cyanobacterium LEGE 12452]|nr:hypothetical protein [Nostocales cyanobacterium LEGE 12452]